MAGRSNSSAWISAIARTALQAAERKCALADGGPLRVGSEIPRTLGATLHRAAADFPDHGVTYLQPGKPGWFDSYRALLDRATRLASGLRRSKIARGRVILLQLPDGPSFISGFWSCVLANCVPAPLATSAQWNDADSTLLKVKAACDLIGDPVILTPTNLANSIKRWLAQAGLSQVEVVAIEDLSKGKETHFEYDADPNGTALLMLTSGSTGQPKGVPLNHSNLIFRSAASEQMNGFTASEVSLNWMPMDHVAGLIYFHVRDVFLACQQVQVPTAYILEDATRWLDCLEHFKATVTFAPNFAYGLVNERLAELPERQWNLESVHSVLNGAEPIVARTAREFLKRLIPHGLPADAMKPAWGMSETSSGVSYSDRFNLETTHDEDAFVEVGAPIPGCALRIVDSQDRLVSEGEVGRLQARGLTLFKGYYANPDLTREAFTTDGWFKTGDLGFIRDNRLTITGREKDVIIINSINYYSHEIEGVVEKIHGVESSFTAACGVRSGQCNTDRLAIFFSPAQHDELVYPRLIQEIRTQVLRQIGVNPEFILPLPKERIPKTSIGKIQRSKLKSEFEAGAMNSLAQRWRGRSDSRVTPQTPLEKRVARIWEDVLRIAPIGLDQRFFELGGDSLQATRILYRVREGFRVNLTLRDLFGEAATVAGMACAIESTPVGPGASSTRIPRTDRDQPIPLSIAQQRIWFLEQLNPGSALYVIPLAIRIHGKLDCKALESSLQQLVDRHEIFRTSFPFNREGPVQTIRSSKPAPLNILQFDSEEACADRFKAEAAAGFDLLNGPVWRASLFCRSELEHVLLLVFHQIAIDGWSLDILFNELETGYRVALGERETRPSLPIQAADFAAWQRKSTCQREAKRTLEYWSSQLAPPLPRIDLKPDTPDLTNPGNDGAAFSMDLDDIDTTRLRRFGQEAAVSAFVQFLALYFVLLQARSGQEDLRVGAAVAGRHSVDVEKLIGFFVNTLVLRMRLNGNPTFREILSRVRETVFSAFAHQQAPYEKVVEQLTRQSRNDASELIQVWFGMQDPMRPFSVGAVRFEPEKIELPVTQFDLSLFMAEIDGRWRATFEYRSKRFHQATIQLMARQFAELVRYTHGHPASRLDELLRVLETVR